MFHIRTKHPKFYLKKDNYQFLDFYRQHNFDKTEEISHNQESEDFIEKSIEYVEIPRKSIKKDEIFNNTIPRNSAFLPAGGNSAFNLINNSLMNNNHIMNNNLMNNKPIMNNNLTNKNTRESSTQTDFQSQPLQNDYEFNGKLVNFCKKSIDLIDYVHQNLMLNNSNASLGMNQNDALFNFNDNILPVKSQLDSIYYEIEKRRKIFSFLEYYQNVKVMH